MSSFIGLGRAVTFREKPAETAPTEVHGIKIGHVAFTDLTSSCCSDVEDFSIQEVSAKEPLNSLLKLIVLQSLSRCRSLDG